MSDLYKYLFILGRPASGKSEFIDFVRQTPNDARKKNFSIGDFKEIDDFVWIWDKFCDDDIWEKAGHPRRFSAHYMKNNPGMTPEGAPLLDFCMQKFNQTIEENYLRNDSFFKDNTLFIEFARGGKDSYKKALSTFSPEMLKDAAIFFIYVTAEESWRRNVARYEENQRHSILAHMVPKETYDHFYRVHDWLDITSNKPGGYLAVNGVEVPFVTMNNEPESTDPAVLTPRYGSALANLRELYLSRGKKA